MAMYEVSVDDVYNVETFRISIFFSEISIIS